MAYAAERCGKDTHRTYLAAEGHRLALIANHKGSAEDLALLHAYWCRFCDGWHVGKNRRVLSTSETPES